MQAAFECDREGGRREGGGCYPTVNDQAVCESSCVVVCLCPAGVTGLNCVSAAGSRSPSGSSSSSAMMAVDT